jgi:hypothetical protein
MKKRIMCTMRSCCPSRPPSPCRIQRVPIACKINARLVDIEKVIRSSGLQTPLSRESLLRSSLLGRQKGDNGKKSSGSLRFRRA